ncbi:hypothetical protein EZV62_001164 [Acer yangbiense]|uniref:Uncharacterized protein n=1 Tax=Acer yangbiense TaxID=1000413 RepID=A0A5C7ITP8_9ROSI|nr:hypothetical protein EZV62_001164 [Acer yangbiense]
MKRMASGPPRHKMNDILWHVCCLIAPPIYSFIYKGYKEGCRVALLFLLLEVISFTLDLLGGSHWSYLLASFLLSILIVSITFYVYFIKRANIRALNKSEAEQLLVVEIVYACLQLVISGFCLIRTLCGVNTNYSASVFPLAYTIVAVGFSFKKSKEDSDLSSHISSNTPSDHLDKDLDELELSSVQVDPADIPSEFSEIEVIPSETTPNKDYVPTSNNANEIQRETRTSTLRKRKNKSLQSDQGLQNEVTPSNTPTIDDSVPRNHTNDNRPELRTLSKAKTTSEHSNDQLEKNQGYCKKPVLVLFLLLEIISFALDQFGGSNWNFLLASFVLSTFGFVISIYTWITIPAVNILKVLKKTFVTTKSEVEQRIIVAMKIDFAVMVFSSFWLIFKYINLIESNNESFLLVSPVAIITLLIVEIALLIPRPARHPKFFQILQVLLILCLALSFATMAFRMNEEGWDREGLYLPNLRR